MFTIHFKYTSFTLRPKICFRRKFLSLINHLFYLSKEMDNVLTGEVGTFDMYAKFTVGKYEFALPET